MVKYGYIYKFTYIPKNLIYVGKRKATAFDESYYGSGVMWKRLISSCDKQRDIKREILEWCSSKEELNRQEKYWIEQLDATNHLIGCNISLGGDGGNLGPEVRERISNTMRERGSQQGKNNGAYGKHWYTDGINSYFCESCPKDCYPGVGKDINERRASKLKGKTRTLAQRANYRESKLGDKNPMKQLTGDKHPNAHKKCYLSPDGLESKYFIPGEEPVGWAPGMKYKLTKNRDGKNNPAYGRSWYNNGVKNLFLREDQIVPDGFVKGMLKKRG